MWIRAALAVALGLLTVPPILVAAASRGHIRLHSISKGRALEGIILPVGIAGVAFVFGGEWSGQEASRIWLLFTPLPLLVWTAVRFGPGTTSLASLALVLVSASYAKQGRGPFALPTADISVLSLQISLLAITVPKLLLAASILERQRTAAALSASEADIRRQLAQLATVYRTAPVGLAFLDTDLKFIRVNDFLAEINGRPAEDHMGRTLHQVLPAPLAAAVETIYREVICKGEPTLDQEIRSVAPSNSAVERIWLASHFPVRDEQGDVLGVNTVVREITEQKKTEESLRSSYEQIQDLAGRLIAAQEAERTRIARELHDDINQRLAALSISLSALKRRPPADPVALQAELTRYQQEVVRLADDVRRVSHELHSGVLQHAGLVAALEVALRGIPDRARHRDNLLP